MVAKLEINMLEGSIWDKVLKFAIPLAISMCKKVRQAQQISV